MLHIKEIVSVSAISAAGIVIAEKRRFMLVHYELYTT